MLVATDADWVFDEVDAALAGPEHGGAAGCARGGTCCPPLYTDRPDLVVLDLQIGNMGGMATCLNIRLEEGAGRLAHVPVLMLLDREADVFLARASTADGWLIKPLDAFRCAGRPPPCSHGETYTEGVPADAGEPLLS